MLYLVVHPESTLGAGKHHGDLDVPLAPKGISSLGPVSEIFKGRKLDLIVTPSVERNSEAATLLASLTGAHIFVDEGLRTWKMGAFSGWPKDKVKAALKTYLRNPDVKVPQGESASHYLKRWKLSFTKYQSMSKHLNIALILNSLSVGAIAGRFKTVDLEAGGESKAYEVQSNMALKEM